MISQDTPFYIAGHAVLDDIIDSKKRTISRNGLGGAVCFSSLAVKSLGYMPRVITRVGHDFPSEHLNYMKDFASISFDQHMDQDQNTTHYKIDASDSHRKLWLLAKCSNLTNDDFARIINDFHNGTLILNPVAGEVSLDILAQMIGKLKYVFADSQGFVRGFESDTGLVFNRILSDCSHLSGLFALKADREELYAWTGIKSTRRAIEQMLGFTQHLILTSGPEVVELYCKDGCVFRAKPLDLEAIDTTGAGDIMLTSFAVRYCETGNLRDSLEFAVAASSLATRTIGVAKALLSRSDIVSHLEKVRVE